MAIVTWINLLAHEEAQLTLQGWEFNKRCVVSGIGNTPTSTRLRAAVQQLAITMNLATGITGVYIGSSFAFFDPGIPTARCEAIRPRALAPDAIELDVIYKERSNRPDNPTFGILQLNCSVQQVSTNKDIDGNALTVTYTGDGSNVSPQAQAVGTNWKIQQGTVSVLRPQSTKHFTRQENVDPSNKQRQFVGTVNAAGWAADPTAAARTWLCTELSAQTRDMRNYEVSYQFQYREGGWDETVIWIDPGTGKPPSDFLTKDGIKTFKEYTTNDFNALALV